MIDHGFSTCATLELSHTEMDEKCVEILYLMQQKIISVCIVMCFMV